MDGPPVVGARCQVCPVTNGLSTVTLVNDSTMLLCGQCQIAHASLIAEGHIPTCHWCGELAVTTAPDRPFEDEPLVMRDACEDCGETMTQAAGRAKRAADREAALEFQGDMARDERGM